ncbi:internal scaffolding protein [Blackfly microvirus SF02]|uniref:Internal scaffolding protein n=1 Tax=Blackfly microvirus SF02 TaxID=2576452 RepID=A0A4P8PLG5_9VIRU|nr:internal scaffolding protein [Blackfly microvirus SF02]
MAKYVYPNAIHDFAKSNGVDASFKTVGPSMTRQEFAEECDVNTLMKRYENYGTSMHMLRPDVLAVHAAGGSFVDFTEMPDNLIDYLAQIKEAEDAFMSLPAVVRREFDNNAMHFVEFASDPSNLDQMRAWGLAAAAPPPKPLESSPVVSTAPAASAPPGGDKPPGGASTHGPT